MTAEQNTGLLERLGSYAPDKKVPFGECVKISKELDLTLEQVHIEPFSCGEFISDVHVLLFEFFSGHSSIQRVDALADMMIVFRNFVSSDICE